MSDLLRAFANARSQAPFGSPATMVPPQQQAQTPRLPDGARESAENLWAVNAGMARPAPRPPSPYQSSDGWDYTQNFGEQVAPAGIVNKNINIPGPFDPPVDPDPDMGQPRPVAPKPAPYAYVGQSRGRH